MKSEKREILRDNDGNVIYNKDGFVCVKLVEESHGRRIGYFNEKTGEISVPKDISTHLLKKADAYGINYDVLKQYPGLKTIIIHDSTGQYNIPKDDWINKGSFLWFKREGFERQSFLSRDIMYQYKV